MPEFKFRTEPYVHQMDCWNLSKDREYYGLLMDLGTGKSKVLLDTSAYLYCQGKIDAQVIVTPKGVQAAWFDEHIPNHFAIEDHEYAYWTAAPRAEERKKLESLMDGKGKHVRTLVMNCEGLTDPDAKAAVYLEKFVKKYRCLLAIDESTSCKNPQAHRTKILQRMAKFVPYRRILTGNPLPNGPLDVFAQFEFLKKGAMGFSNFYGFRNRFAVMQDMRYGAKSFKKVVGFRDKHVLQEMMKKFAFIIKKEDCLDLPEKIYQTVDAEMSAEQSKAYDQMAESAFIQLTDGRTVTAQMVMTQLTRLHQIACGFMQTDDGIVEFKGTNSRMGAMMDQIEQAPGKVIIWASYRHNIKQVVAALTEKYGKDSVATFYGDTNPEERRNATPRFQDPESSVRFMVANPQAGKFGNTWTAGTTVIYFSNSYNLEDRQQSEDRSHRIGQRQSVVYIDLRAPGTVDDRILKVLKAKKKLTDEIVSSNWKWLLSNAS